MTSTSASQNDRAASSARRALAADDQNRQKSAKARRRPLKTRRANTEPQRHPPPILKQHIGRAGRRRGTPCPCSCPRSWTGRGRRGRARSTYAHLSRVPPWLLWRVCMAVVAEPRECGRLDLRCRARIVESQNRQWGLTCTKEQARDSGFPRPRKRAVATRLLVVRSSLPPHRSYPINRTPRVDVARPARPLSRRQRRAIAPAPSGS